MKRLVNEELNRVRQIMGVIYEQDSEIINQDGKRFERTVTDVPPYESDNWRAEFASGKFSATDLEGSPDLTGLVKWLNEPDKVGLTLVVAVTAGTSRVPVKPGGEVAKALEAAGKEPTNKGLAEARGETAVEMVKNQIKSLIPEKVFNNIEFTADLSKVEQGPEWDKIDATAQKYTTHQFLSTTAYATGRVEVLTELPDICNGELNGSGGQAKKKNKGPGGLRYASYTENEQDGEYLGQHYDLGLDTVGMITMNFNAIKIPDMFQITYNNQTYTSSGPGGEGFVSNSFKTCEEGSTCYNGYIRKIEKLGKKSDTKKKKVTTAEGKEKILNSRYWKMLVGTHGYKPGVDIPLDKRIDREWIIAFFERFEPGSKNLVSRMFTNKKRMKYNPDFTDGWSAYEEMADGSWEPTERAKVVEGKDVWDKINDIWISLDDKVEDAQKDLDKASGENAKEIARLEAELADLMANGNPNSYAKSMTRQLKWMGFDQGVIGTNGSITFEKVQGAADMYLQVYAPLDSTIWRASVTCQDLSPGYASS
jgi:hypothetical protein|tara:strand:- start:3720 stop:5327 length:1608 start_codon:yes stop_codon:yes gene_type:complete